MFRATSLAFPGQRPYVTVHGRVFNLLNTPGHEDFSEDTYRTLTAVDTAVMVIDAAKGIASTSKRHINSTESLPPRGRQKTTHNKNHP